VRGVDAALAGELLDAAGACALFLLNELRDERGRLLRSYNNGRAKIDAYLEDHAFRWRRCSCSSKTTCESVGSAMPQRWPRS